MRRRHELEDEMKQAEVSAFWRGLESGACDREQTKPEVTELWRVKDGGSGRAVLRGKKGGAGEGLGPRGPGAAVWRGWEKNHLER